MQESKEFLVDKEEEKIYIKNMLLILSVIILIGCEGKTLYFDGRIA